MASGWIEHDEAGYKAVVRMANGRRRAKRFPKRAAAKAWLSEMQTAVDRGTFVDPRLGKVRFGDWAKEFRASDGHSLRPTTLDQNARTYRNHILPAFEKAELGKITQTAVQRWVNDLVSAGLAPSTVQKYYQTLGKAFTGAVDAGLLARSPCRGIKRPQLEHFEMRFLTTAQVSKLAKKIDGRYRALVFVAAYGGLRIGELAGLRRARFADGVLDIREQAVEVGGHVHFGPPKTKAGRRRVPLPDPVVAILEEHIKEYVPDEPDAFIFGGVEGHVLRAATWRRRVLNPAATAAKLGVVSPHDLRHTAVAIWIAAGIPVKEIADRAGHGSVAVVLDRYGHLFPDSPDSFRERVGELFKP